MLFYSNYDPNVVIYLGVGCIVLILVNLIFIIIKKWKIKRGKLNGK